MSTGSSATERAIVASLVVAGCVVGWSVITGRVGVRVWVAAVMALAPATQVLAEWSGRGLSYEVWESQRIALLVAVACSVGAVGLMLRKSWARWLALAAALGGIGTGGLNIVWTIADPQLLTWIQALEISFSAIVGLALVGPSVRAQFESEGADGLWSSSDLAVRSIRWTVLSQLVAIPMLLVYAWVQPIVPQTRGMALVLAAVLGVGALLCMGRKLLGAIVMSLAGPALLILAGLTAWFAHSRGAPGHLHVAGYYACFWAPAGVISTIAGLRLAKPVWRLWHELADRA